VECYRCKRKGHYGAMCLIKNCCRKLQQRRTSTSMRQMSCRRLPLQEKGALWSHVSYQKLGQPAFSPNAHLHLGKTALHDRICRHKKALKQPPFRHKISDCNVQEIKRHTLLAAKCEKVLGSRSFCLAKIWKGTKVPFG